jgi:hypothetical protein
MKTEELVTILARQTGSVPRGIVQRKLGIAIGAGTLASAAVSIGIAQHAVLPLLGWVLLPKLAFVLGLIAAGARLSERSSRPGASVRRSCAGAALVVLAMAAVAGVHVMQAPAGAFPELLYGSTWATCPGSVTALSLVPFLAVMWAMADMAPTRPRLAGFSAGLLAGGIGALAYLLLCPERSPLFVLVWYSAGVAIPAVLGAILGPRLLRW